MNPVMRSEFIMKDRIQWRLLAAVRSVYSASGHEQGGLAFRNMALGLR